MKIYENTMGSKQSDYSRLSFKLEYNTLLLITYKYLSFKSSVRQVMLISCENSETLSRIYFWIGEMEDFKFWLIGWLVDR